MNPSAKPYRVNKETQGESYQILVQGKANPYSFVLDRKSGRNRVLLAAKVVFSPIRQQDDKLSQPDVHEHLEYFFSH